MLILVFADEPPSDATRQVIRDSYSAMKDVVGGVLGRGPYIFRTRARTRFTGHGGAGPRAGHAGATSQRFPMRVTSTVTEGATKLSNMLGARLDPMLTPEPISTAATAVKSGSF